MPPTNKVARAGGVLALLLGGAVLGGALLGGVRAAPSADSFADPAFERLWGRTDFLVASGAVARSWYWGPAAGRALVEPFADAPSRTHKVQYFDKSRMEINNPAASNNDLFYVTNGLLTIELISGKIQVGSSDWVADDKTTGGPAIIPLASDSDDATAPTYASFRALANTPLGDHRATDRRGQIVQEAVNRAGNVTVTPDRAAYGVRSQQFIPETGHNIPNVFWDFLNGRGPVRVNGQTIEQLLSDPWFFTSGYPISEAYWARVKIAGEPHDVLIQPFERRVLTYIPDYAAAWRVQMGNIGQHYVQWRYPKGLPAPEPTAVPLLALPPDGVGSRR